jgi:hypothetical protein
MVQPVMLRASSARCTSARRDDRWSMRIFHLALAHHGSRSSAISCVLSRVVMWLNSVWRVT